MEIMITIIKQSFMITSFVFVMMLIVDFFNVLTAGRLSILMQGGHWRQYVAASFLGATPGCLGAYMNVSFYVHGLISFGALVGGMIATSGDEAFVMLAQFPGKAMILFFTLFLTSIVFAWITDKLVPVFRIKPCEKCSMQEIHALDSMHFEEKQIAQNFTHISIHRLVLLFALVGFLVALSTGWIGPVSWGWKRVTLTILMAVATVIVGTVSDHYLSDHIWKHIAKKHLGRVFLWSFFALFFIHIGLARFNMEGYIQGHLAWVLVISALVGLIPESGPHLIFVMMFGQGLIPFSVLFTSSFVQDGHGMLPLFSYTIKDSLLIKVFNLVFGLIIGGFLFILGL